MQAHRLKREIISTALANRIVDIAGPVFILRLREQTGAPSADIVAAFEIANALFKTSGLLGQVNQQDNQVPAQRLMALQSLLSGSLATLTHGVLSVGEGQPVQDRIQALTAAREALVNIATGDLPAYERALEQRRIKQNARDGIPTELAEAIARTKITASAAQLSTLAARSDRSAADVAGAYLAMGDALSLDRLRTAA